MFFRYNRFAYKLWAAKLCMHCLVSCLVFMGCYDFLPNKELTLASVKNNVFTYILQTCCPVPHKRVILFNYNFLLTKCLIYIPAFPDRTVNKVTPLQRFN